MMLPQNNVVKNCRYGLKVVFAIAVTCYSVGFGIYEAYLGGRSAHLVVQYYDYSISVPNSTLSVAIDALPRDIYKNTKENAGLLLTFGLIGVLGTIVAVGFLFWKEKESAVLSLSVANASVTLIPFCYSAFLTWKVHSLSTRDKETWDSVDPNFVKLLWKMEDVMIATVVPGVFWLIVACIVGAQSRWND
jgi:putative flippase GtrA